VTADKTPPDAAAPDDKTPAETDATGQAPASRYPELDELQQEISRRLRDNQRFLEHFLDEDFPDENEDEAEEIDPDDFEEL